MNPWFRHGGRATDERGPRSGPDLPHDHRLGLRDARREVDDEPLAVEGDLPPWLSGVLVRNGPGRFRIGDRRVNHWFDGLALLRRFAVDGAAGEVRLTTRFLRSEQFRRVERDGALAFPEFGTAPDRGPLAALGGRDRRGPVGSLAARLPLGGLAALFGPATDNAVVTVGHLGGRHLALTETDRAVAYDPRTLETAEGVAFDDAVAAGTAGSLAHVHRDPRRRETVGVATAFGPTGGYVPYRLPDGASEREPIARLRRRTPAYLHSFGLTADSLVLTEHPYRFHPTALLRGGSFAEAFRWHPDEGTRFTVLDRATGAVRATFETGAFFVFHHVNAVERDDTVVVDLVAFPDPSVVDAFRLDRFDRPGFAPPGAELRRYRLDPGGTVVMERLHPGPVEFPTIDYAGRAGRPYRCVYGVGNRARPPRDFANRVLKVDLRDRTTRTWGEGRCYPSEALFVPREPREGAEASAFDPSASTGNATGAAAREPTAPTAPADSDEDDGVLLSVVLDADAAETFLVVLDAETLDERARATFPEPLPFGFHGQFYRRPDEPSRSMA